MPSELATRWRNKAVTSRHEAERIRRTMGPCTDAEMRCNLRAEMWDACAHDIDAEIALLLAENERLKQQLDQATGEVERLWNVGSRLVTEKHLLFDEITKLRQELDAARKETNDGE